MDTIFEIGGQDSKYISVDDGVVVDFEMNKVCAAGTGSFLEEQAEKLGISIVDEFGDLALGSRSPVHLGDRCTVFMESDLNSHQQKGAATEDLVGGLAYSIVHNYLQKVVGTKRIGKQDLLPGRRGQQPGRGRRLRGGDGQAHHGAAALRRHGGDRRRDARAHAPAGGGGGGQVGRDAVQGIRRGPGALCPGQVHLRVCANQCEIRRVRVEGESKPLYYGGRCEKWEQDERRAAGGTCPTSSRSGCGCSSGTSTTEAAAPRRSAPTIGIPRALMVYYQQFPFWRAFFEELGFRVVLSRPTDRGLIQRPSRCSPPRPASPSRWSRVT